MKKGAIPTHLHIRHTRLGGANDMTEVLTQDNRKSPGCVRLLPYRARVLRGAAAEQIDWGVRLLGAPDIWKLTQGEGVTVAVLDTGSSPAHPDLADAFLRRGKKVAGGNFTSAKKDDFIDCQDHGTHCSGIIAAGRNGRGVVGVAPRVKILPVKILGDDGSGELDWLVRGIRWCIANAGKYRVRVLSMSLGAPFGDTAIRDALAAAKKAGLITVCAAGNEGNASDLGYPARYAEAGLCLAVGAVRTDKKITDFSNTGRGLAKMGLVAPGFEVLSTITRGRYARFSGTSMAAPHVAGVLALALAKHDRYGGATPLTNLDQAYEHCRRFCVDLGGRGRDRVYGLGLPVLTEENVRALRVR